MQHRKTQSSHSKASASSRASNRGAQHHGSRPQARVRSAKMQSTAANDRYMKVLDVDIFQQPPNFFQRLVFINSAWIMRLFIVAAVTGTVFYLYPSSLSKVNAGIDQMVDALPGSDSKSDKVKKTSASIAVTENVDPNNEELDDILDKVASEIAAADELQQHNDSRGDSSAEELNRALREQFERKPEKVSLLKNMKRELLAMVDTASRLTSAPAVKPISTVEINRLLDQYSESYQYGNASAVGRLFMDSRDERQQRLIEKLRKNYGDLFDSSKQRWVEFQDLNWMHENDRAIGKGRIKSETTLRNNNRRKSSANVLIELQRVDNAIKIASLTLSNQTSYETTAKKTSNSKFGTKSSKSPNRVTVSSTIPSQSELDALVSRFVWAYEGGDIVVLGGLLAKNIISNDGSSKADIKKDYDELFSSTSYRQMMLRDLRWKFTKKHAKGVATMKAVVLGKNKEVTTVEGKIQFVAKKINNKVFITHLYHTDRSQ